MPSINHLAHKDARPQETIRRIEEILSRIGLYERDKYIKWKSFENGSYSCMLTYLTYPILKSNGKGLTKEFALASAFGEYMERLQGLGQYFQFSNIGFFPPKECLCSNMQKVSLAQLFSEIPEIMKLYGHIAEQLPEELQCIPYADLISHKTVMVPHELLTMTILTNGMCAGNSPQEAISQGISEIFERYIIAMLAEKKVLGLPDIEPEDLHIHEGKLRNLIHLLVAKEYQLTIKDASLGGVFPVVAVIVENKEGTKIGVSFGSDPDFEVALQRCITELFQGKTDLDVDVVELERNAHAQPIASIFNNPHLLYALLKNNLGHDCHAQAFTCCEANTSYLSFQLDIIRRLGKKIFIHDFSILGFPAYQVFIEDLSCIFSKRIMPFYYLNERDDFLRGLFSLDDASASRLIEIKKKFSPLMHTDYDVFDLLYKRLFFRVPTLKWMESNLLNALLYIEEDDSAAALVDLGYFYPKKGEQILKQILVDYCTFQLETGTDRGQVMQKLSLQYSESRYAYSLHHLLDKNYGSFMFANQEPIEGKKFSNLPIPRCLDEAHCDGCSLRIRCLKDSWQVLREKIRLHLVEPEQTNLLALYQI